MLGDSVRRRQPQWRPPRPPRTAGTRLSERDRKRLLMALPLALLVPFFIGYLLAVFVIFPPTEVSGAGIAVPDLIGRSATDAQRALAAAGLGPLATSDLPHPSAPEGQVLAQSPLPGQQLRPGVGVRVAVSIGRPRVMVPDVLGFGADRAESLLRRAGFEVSRSVQESPAIAGRVIRTDPEPGQQRALPATVTLIVSAGPPRPPDVDTLGVPR